MPLEKMRNFAFWSLSNFKDKLIKQAYRQLYSFEKVASNSPEMREYQEKAWAELLRHATVTTSYYRKYQGAQLADFPVINKGIIKGQQENFLSNQYDRADLITMRTSGSTGSPFTCYQDKDKKRRVTAEVIFYTEKAGYAVGRKLIYLKSPAPGVNKSRLVQWLQNETILEITKLDDERLDRLIADILQASRKGSTVLAYATTYDVLKDYFQRKGIENLGEGRIRGLISSSEILFDDTRAAMAKVFGCPCYSRYSNQENGIIGQDEAEANVFFINEPHYYVEVMKLDEDVPAAEGEIGRIVITDLYNKAMPLIRYDTGDVGAIILKEKGAFGKGHCRLSGRAIDIVYDSMGNRLSPI